MEFNPATVFVEGTIASADKQLQKAVETLDGYEQMTIEELRIKCRGARVKMRLAMQTLSDAMELIKQPTRTECTSDNSSTRNISATGTCPEAETAASSSNVSNPVR